MTDKNLLILDGLGSDELSDNDVAISDQCATLCNELGIGLEYQRISSTEEMLGAITHGNTDFDALIVNPGAESERDRTAMSSTIAGLEIPVVEVHRQNIFLGGSAIRPLYIPNGDVGFVCGLGATSYLLAIRAMARQLNE